MSFSKFAFIFFCSLTVCSISLGDFILFEDCIDAQQKTEIRYDVPDGCVLTGLGFRAAYDNITTMHCRYHRLLPNGKLADPRQVQLGSEPNHACEAKVLLPDGWVAVGFGAAGEPEWDVTVLRIWARPLKSDGTLGEMKAFSDGFKPERGTEREIITAEPDRIMVGAGLRFHHNDIQGILAPNDNTAGGCIQALAAQNLDGKVPITGQDAELSAAQRIVEGTQTMTVFKDTRELGKKAVELAIKMANGESIEETTKLNNNKMDVSSYLLVPVAVDKDNIKEVLVDSGYLKEEDVFK